MQEVRNQLLTALQFQQVAQRLQNPCPQLPSAHWRDRSIECRQQAGVATAPRFDQFEVCLRRGIEHHAIRRRIAAQRREMVDFAPELVLQVMDNRTGRADRCRHLRATEPVERFDLEMLAQRETRLLRQKRVGVASQRVVDLGELISLLVADQ